MTSEPKIPDGFTPHFKRSKFTDPWEPLYSRKMVGRVRIGLHLSAAHCDSRGLVHGGLIATLADNAMGLSCVQVMNAAGFEAAGLVTISLQTDYMSTAKLGAWLAVDPDYIKCGKSICFARALITADDKVIAKANASFKVIQPRVD